MMATAKKVALITGITGQDGSYLAELLLVKGYKVHGVVRPQKDNPCGYAFENIANIKSHSELALHECNIVDAQRMTDIFKNVLPDEVYHLAAQSNTVISFDNEWGTFETNTKSTVALLSLIRDYKPDARFYFAASSELFGDAVESPQNELTPFSPNSPYGISKVASFYMTKLYREKHSLFACSGICFSHESPRRAEIFVTRKITSTVAKIRFGLAKELRLGNLETRRDWGFSGDFVTAIWSMLQQAKPSDYVIGTGENHTIREFVEKAFEFVDLDWRDYVVSDPTFYRPSEARPWLADIAKANRDLNWRPHVAFKELVAMMMKKDVERVQQSLLSH
jgi:GDPmannose 4,6-dehydratase